MQPSGRGGTITAAALYGRSIAQSAAFPSGKGDNPARKLGLPRPDRA